MTNISIEQLASVTGGAAPVKMVRVPKDKADLADMALNCARMDAAVPTTHGAIATGNNTIGDFCSATFRMTGVQTLKKLKRQGLD